MTYATNPYELDRFVGALLGAALGDVLGWPHEDRARRVQRNDNRNLLEMAPWVKRSGGRFQQYEELIEPGSYSDDTQLIIAVARSRLNGGEWWLRLASVEYPFWTAYQRGGGGASLRAARSLLKGILPWEGTLVDRRKYFEAGGNGVAMRIAPHVLANARENDFGQLATDVLVDGVLTHGHPRALLGALAYSFALWTALQRQGTLGFGELVDRVINAVRIWARPPSLGQHWPTWQHALDVAPTFIATWYKSVEEVLSGLEIIKHSLNAGALAIDDETLRNLGCFDRKINGAGTVSALAAIFLASKHAASPFEAVARAALAEGADTDTIASMTGALVGAIAGTDWLGRWGERVQDCHYIAQLAQDLAAGRWDEPQPFQNLTQAQLNRFLASLRSGTQSVKLPIGGTASVKPHDGVKGGNVQTSAWRLISDSGQTLVVKSISVVPKAGAPAEISRFPLNQTLQPTMPVAAQNVRAALAGVGQRARDTTRGVFAGITLQVHDLALSKEFYGILLGIEVTRETNGRVQLGPSFVLQHNSEANPLPKAVTVFVNVNDVALCRALIVDRLGMSVSPITSRGKRTWFTCVDPDGYPLEVFH